MTASSRNEDQTQTLSIVRTNNMQIICMDAFFQETDQTKQKKN